MTTMLYKILLVDDDSEFREEFRHCFSEYDIVEARDGNEAVDILRWPNEISLIIMDVKMPGPSGTDILPIIKAQSPDLRVIVLTGHSSENVAIDALRAHADDYIEKPFEIETMRRAIESCLSSGALAQSKQDDGSNKCKIRRAKDFVWRNCFKRVRLSDAARAVSMAPKYLSRIFKEETGVGFSEFRLQVQLGKARELLDSGGLNVSQIADKLGYKNPESFVRQFKKIAGMTPARYRQKTRRRPGRNKNKR